VSSTNFKTPAFLGVKPPIQEEEDYKMATKEQAPVDD
jgi:hypothetical protein